MKLSATQGRYWQTALWIMVKALEFVLRLEARGRECKVKAEWKGIRRGYGITRTIVGAGEPSVIQCRLQWIHVIVIND